MPNKFQNFPWEKYSCFDQPHEINYFHELIGYLDATILPNKNWEEPKNLSEQDKLECQKLKLSCKLDDVHCGPKYKQFVLGRLYVTKCFIPCPNYEVLNISDWSMNKNDLFIKYISKQKKQNINHNLQPCPIFPIRIYVNKSDIPPHSIVKKGGSMSIKNLKTISKFASEVKPGGITSRELCLLIHLKFNFYAIENNDGTYRDYVVLSTKPMTQIKRWYNQNNKPMPKFIKI